MRLVCFFALACLSPHLWAEDVKRSPINLELEFSNSDDLTGRLKSQMFFLEMQYDFQDSFVERGMFTFPVFSPGLESLDDPWRAGIEFVPPYWEGGKSDLIGDEPDRESEIYFALHYLTNRTDARAIIPLAHSIDGHYLKPSLVLRELKIFKVRNYASIFVSGFWDQEDTLLRLGLEISRGHFTAKISSDKSWSLGYQTPLSLIRF